MNETNAKFTLKYSYEGSEDYSPMDITFEIPSDATIDQMLFNFECFLKACGFIFDTNFIQSGKDEYDLPEDEEPEYGCMADKDTEDDESPSCCGKNPVGECCDSHEHYTDEWNEGTKNLAKELKAQREIREKTSKSAEMCAELAKSKWVQSFFGPSLPNWRNS